MANEEKNGQNYEGSNIELSKIGSFEILVTSSRLGSQHLERPNLERSIYRNSEISNIKITKFVLFFLFFLQLYILFLYLFELFEHSKYIIIYLNENL